MKHLAAVRPIANQAIVTKYFVRTEMTRSTLKKRPKPVPVRRAIMGVVGRTAQRDSRQRPSGTGKRAVDVSDQPRACAAAARANPSIVLREVATLVKITERAVQRIIADLEGEGYIEREKVGRQNHYRILVDRKLKHAVEGHRTIGDLLRIIDDER